LKKKITYPLINVSRLFETNKFYASRDSNETTYAVQNKLKCVYQRDGYIFQIHRLTVKSYRLKCAGFRIWSELKQNKERTVLFPDADITTRSSEKN
jgi:hypothetical protein